MSHTEHVFLHDAEPDLARVARRALSVLASDKVGDGRTCEVHRELNRTAAAVDWVQKLSTAAVSPDPCDLSAAIGELKAAGVSDDALSFDIIPEVARRLGANWTDDLISFADVTIGCAGLQSVLHKLPDNVPDLPATDYELHLDCLVVVPAGAQHTLGALVLAKQVRQVGHRVSIDLKAQPVTISERAQNQQFDLILISASDGADTQPIEAIIAQCRRHWPESKVVLGGAIGDQDLTVTNRIGADLVTADWQVALALCK